MPSMDSLQYFLSKYLQIEITSQIGYGQIIWTKALVNFPGPGFLQQKLSFLTIGWSIIIDQLSLDQVNYHGPLRFSNTLGSHSKIYVQGPH